MNDARTYVENYLGRLLLDFQRKGLGQSVTELNVWEKVLIYKYSLDGYESLNGALRQGKPHPMERLLNEALSKLPDFKGGVMRGARLSGKTKEFYQQERELGLPFVEPAFMSSSTSFSVANMFSRSDTIFYIDSEHGKGIEQLAFFGAGNPTNEKEVLFKSQSLFLVDSIKTGLRTEIFLKELTP